MSVRRPEEKGSLGNRISSFLVDLPVGEPNPVIRLHRVSHSMQAHKDSGQAVTAEALVGLAGFAPPTLHALGARVAAGGHVAANRRRFQAAARPAATRGRS